jgi:hypothetical protein
MLYAPEAWDFSDRARSLVELVASMLAPALERGELARRERLASGGRAKQRATPPLPRASRTIVRRCQHGASGERFGAEVVAATGASRAGLWLLGSGQPERIASHCGPGHTHEDGAAREAQLENVVLEVLRTGKSVWMVSDKDRRARHPELPAAEEPACSALACLPILTQGCEGALAYTFDTCDALDGSAREFLHDVVHAGQHALERTRALDVNGPGVSLWRPRQLLLFGLGVIKKAPRASNLPLRRAQLLDTRPLRGAMRRPGRRGLGPTRPKKLNGETAGRDSAAPNADTCRPPLLPQKRLRPFDGRATIPMMFVSKVASKWMRRAWLFSAAVLGALAEARAAESVQQLEWDAPAACPSGQTVRARLSEVLGEGAERLKAFERVRGVVVQRGDGFLLTLEVLDGERRAARTIRAALCEDLAEAAALAVAWAMRHRATEGAEVSQPATGTDASVRDADDSARAADGGPRVPDGAQDEAPPLRLSAGAEALLDTSSLPSLAPGVGLQAGFRFGARHLAITGVLLPTATTTFASGSSVEFGLLAAGVRASQRLLDAWVDVSLSAGLEAGRFFGEGRGLIGARRANNVWLAPQVGLALEVPFTRTLALEWRVEALTPLARRAYVIDEVEPVHRPPALTARSALGVIWAL